MKPTVRCFVDSFCATTNELLHGSIAKQNRKEIKVSAVICQDTDI